MRAIKERDLESILDIYADDATYMPPGRSPSAGKAALREVWASYLQREAFAALSNCFMKILEHGHLRPTYRVTNGGAPEIGHVQVTVTGFRQVAFIIV